MLTFPSFDLLKIIDRNNIEFDPTISSNFLGTDKKTIPTKPTSQQILPITKAGLKEFAKEVATKYGLDYDKFNYTIQNESGYNAEAKSPNGICIGLGQYLLDTWISNCSPIDERTDPTKSIECMGKMWSQGLEYQWDAYCCYYLDSKCVVKRNLYPGSILCN